MVDTKYGFGTTLNVSYEEAIARVTAALKDQGFGVLTEIDVQATLKQKLDVDHRRYVILGACNPPLAHRALQAEPDIGLLLPCNVIVYEGDQTGQSVVSIVDPMVMVQVSDNTALTAIAADAQQRLKNVIDALS
jgi:uncharacterized protein (DUF302 family)